MKNHNLNKSSNDTNKHKRKLKPYRKTITLIDEKRFLLETASDDDLQAASAALKRRARAGESLDTLLPEAFALVCETSRRVLGLLPFDVQIAAGIVLHRGSLAQMQTGEGKTLAAVLPAYLNALTGDGVHILTFNDYLARRDACWMGPVYRFLGLTVAYLQEGMAAPQRKSAYTADIVYMTAREAGFDFLRDQRCTTVDQQVHRVFHYVIVDEADSIMIDEARVPLVIAGEAPEPPTDPLHLAQLVRCLQKDIHYYSDQYSRDVNFTDTGIEWLEEQLSCGNLHDLHNNRLLSALNLALQAELLLKRDIDYIVRDNTIQLVDEFTGRVAEKRRWPYGLQTAVEAKEGLDIQPEGMILGFITLQNYLKLYDKIAGMTATADTSADEFDTFYRLKVVVIPSNRPCIRIDLDDRVFTHKSARNTALVKEIADAHSTGRPILVGTASVEESENLARRLYDAGVPCQVLNAKNDETEAKIIADAGALGAVTISTNMAGRGTDIRLGGCTQQNRSAVLALGGLYVIGTNRHESRRIDNQLRGRAGRQGDPGSSCFFISLEDDLMVRYRVDQLIPSKYFPPHQDSPIDNPVVAREIARAQRIIEAQNFEIRKTLREYSFIVEEQRKIFHEKRNDILSGAYTLNLLALHASERWEMLCSRFNELLLHKVEKTITLFHMDQCWTEHLDTVSNIREGVHLWRIGGKNPVFEFHKEVIQSFDQMEKRLEERIVETFSSVTLTKSGIDMEAEGLTGPTSTWTYLINDNPFEDQVQRLLIGSNAFALATAVVFPMIFPFIILSRVVKYFKRKQKK